MSVRQIRTSYPSIPTKSVVTRTVRFSASCWALSRMQKNRVEGTYVRVPRRGEGRDRAPLAAGGRLVTPAKPLAGSCGSLRQVANSDQVVRRQAEDEHPAHSRAAAMSGLAQQPDGLEPAEDFLHALALALAHAVAGVARGAPIDRTRPARDVLGHVRRHLDQPEGR